MTIETDLLLILIPEEGAPADKLERFIEDVLNRAGIWDSWSAPDGVEFCRVVECNPTRVRLRRPEEANWTLYFDIIPGAWSPRRISTIAEAIEAPEQAEWRVALKGAAMVKAATLVVESVYAIPVERGEDAW